MKKKIILGFAILAIAAVAAWNVNYGSKMKGMSDLSLANVEALAAELYWDGKWWNDTDTHWLGTDWLPVKTTCQVQYGIPPYVTIVDGYKVTCNYGNGNCLVASGCTNA